MPLDKFPRAPADKVTALRGDVWNRVAAKLETGMNIQVAPPLMLSQTPSGYLISIVMFEVSCYAKITGTATRAGVYTGRVWLRPTSMPDPTSSSSWADTDIGTDPGADNAYLWNTREVGNSSGHTLAAGTIPDLIPGQIFGAWTDGKLMVRIDECQ